MVNPSIDNLAPVEGDTLTATAGTWTNGPTSTTYRWTRDGVTIGGATSSTYLTTGDDVGVVIRVGVVKASAGGKGAEVLSAPPAAVLMAPPVNSVAPVIASNADLNAPVEGDTLTISSDGTWSGSPTFTYQWRGDGVNIDGATANSWVIAGHTGEVIDCVVTGTNAGGTDTADSNDSGAVA